MSTAHHTTSTVRYVEIETDPGYRIGDDGTVWSCVVWRRGDKVVFGEWKQLKPSPQYKGHMTVWLGRKRQAFVHRLVLEAFVGLCPEGMECRHIDGDPGNNRLQNLMWGSRKENHADSVRHGTAYMVKGFDHPGVIVDEPDVKTIVGLCRSGKTQAEVAGMFGVHETTVGAIMTGRVWSEITGIVYAPTENGRKGQKRAKLTDEQVAIIRATVDPTRRDGKSASLAREWGVSIAAVRLIARGMRRCSPG